MDSNTYGGAAGKVAITDYIAVARRYWRGILAVTLIATLGGLGWYALQPHVYSAEASGLVLTSGGDNLSLSLAGDNLAKSRAKNYKSIAETRRVADEVAQSLGNGLSGNDLASHISVTVPTDTTEIRISATSTDPAQAKAVADAWVSTLISEVHSIEKSASNTGQPPVSIVPLQSADLPSSPVSPNLRLALGIGIISGLLLGLGYALLRNHFDRRIRTASDVQDGFGIPVLGAVPQTTDLSGGVHLLDAGAASGALQESLRELRTNLRYTHVDKPMRILLVTSSVPDEGKSTVIGNLATTMAANGERVVVVDGDLRRPTVHKVFGVTPGVGVTDILAGRAGIADVVQPYAESPNISVLGAGRVPPDPSELLGSRAMVALLEDLSRDAIVLIDSPPLVPVTDAAILSRIADGTLVVVRSGKTDSDDFQYALTSIRRVQGTILGAVLNFIPVKKSGSYRYGYYAAAQDETAPAKHPARRPTRPARARTAAPLTNGIGHHDSLAQKSWDIDGNSVPAPRETELDHSPEPAYGYEEALRHPVAVPEAQDIQGQDDYYLPAALRDRHTRS